MCKSFLSRISIAAALMLSLCASAHAQSREAGWEAGFDLVYQDSTTWDFDGGSKLDFDSDLGLSITFGYRINSHLETSFALDWSNSDYRASLVRANGQVTTAHGEIETFTPRFNLQLNLLDKPFTPFAMAGVAYHFIDTNIPNGRPSTGCWWDPWYGYICTTVQSTATTDEFGYQAGVGVRWDVSPNTSLRFAYERHWIDLSKASSAPFIDQLKLGLSFVY